MIKKGDKVMIIIDTYRCKDIVGVVESVHPTFLYVGVDLPTGGSSHFPVKAGEYITVPRLQSVL